MKMTFQGREFQFWQYRVSHGELLVRSPKHGNDLLNVDLMFVGVEYVDLPRFLPGLELDNAADDDISRAAERLGQPVDRREVFVLQCQDRRHIVVAGVLQVAESDMEIFESPFE
ncbi:MAG: hypothetical protein JWO36_6369 [Myxococcales bacterium]|nr:hypothetical protein [Myxococcales bacterium]